jgi:hypothetical protein
MWGWLRELIEIRREGKVCQACEILKVELSNERREKEILLQHLLTPRPTEPERTTAPELQVPISRKHIPWKMRQQMLEEDDRKKAQVLAEFRKREEEARSVNPSLVVPAQSIEDLEKNLGVVQEK